MQSANYWRGQSVRLAHFQITTKKMAVVLNCRLVSYIMDWWFNRGGGGALQPLECLFVEYRIRYATGCWQCMIVKSKLFVWLHAVTECLPLQWRSWFPVLCYSHQQSPAEPPKRASRQAIHRHQLRPGLLVRRWPQFQYLVLSFLTCHHLSISH